MSDLTPKGFSDGQYVDRYLLRDKLYQEDAITMGGVAILNNFPAADVVPVVKARWKEDAMMFTDKDGASRGGTYGFECSACGGFYVGKSNFCPNCGADMREVTT